MVKLMAFILCLLSIAGTCLCEESNFKIYTAKGLLTTGILLMILCAGWFTFVTLESMDEAADASKEELYNKEDAADNL